MISYEPWLQQWKNDAVYCYDFCTTQSRRKAVVAEDKEVEFTSALGSSGVLRKSGTF